MKTKTIKLNVGALLDGRWHPAGDVVDCAADVATRLVKLKRAAFSDDMPTPMPAALPAAERAQRGPLVETAAGRKPRRKK